MSQTIAIEVYDGLPGKDGADGTNAPDAVTQAQLDAARRPSWLPAEVASSTLDPLGTTVANIALPIGTMHASWCDWWGPGDAGPSAARCIIGVVGAVTLFKSAIYSEDGVLRYSTNNEAATVASTGTKTMPFVPVGTPYEFAYGEPFFHGWLNVGTTGVQIPRFGALSPAVVNLSTLTTRRRALSIAGLSDIPSDLTGAAQTAAIFYGQAMI